MPSYPLPPSRDHSCIYNRHPRLFPAAIPPPPSLRPFPFQDARPPSATRATRVLNKSLFHGSPPLLPRPKSALPSAARLQLICRLQLFAPCEQQQPEGRGKLQEAGEGLVKPGQSLLKPQDPHKQTLVCSVLKERRLLIPSPTCFSVTFNRPPLGQVQRLY